MDATVTSSWSPMVELRQYTLHPGKRDVLIGLFDRNFVEAQEQSGITVIGPFRERRCTQEVRPQKKNSLTYTDQCR